VLIALLIRATMGGPVLYRHNRVGFGGKQFGCLKFRTMVQDADVVLDEYFRENPEAATEWATSQKLKRDPRITFLGQVLRKSSLDELPQLFNILRGEMSCVGPRPITHEELDRYGSVANDYLRARPGLTGLWQIKGRSSVDYAGRVMLDAQYLRTWSLRADLIILASTAAAVIRFEQAS
jgi:exopolysaccharide production protein ExoY